MLVLVDNFCFGAVIWTYFIVDEFVGIGLKCPLSALFKDKYSNVSATRVTGYIEVCGPVKVLNKLSKIFRKYQPKK